MARKIMASPRHWLQSPGFDTRCSDYQGTGGGSAQGIVPCDIAARGSADALKPEACASGFKS
jgi:hypothetical protein